MRTISQKFSKNLSSHDIVVNYNAARPILYVMADFFTEIKVAFKELARECFFKYLYVRKK